jgi:hypothetical protein
MAAVVAHPARLAPSFLPNLLRNSSILHVRPHGARQCARRYRNWGYSARQRLWLWTNADKSTWDRACTTGTSTGIYNKEGSGRRNALQMMTSLQYRAQLVSRDCILDPVCFVLDAVHPDVMLLLDPSGETQHLSAALQVRQRLVAICSFAFCLMAL